jgi:hypothetical protein
MNATHIPIKDIKSNPNNPRIIKDDKFKKLVQSIIDFPRMLEIRPIVVNDEMVVLGGNMRLKACKEAGLKEIPVIKASDLTPEQQVEFIIKDNVGFGEWDWAMLANEWDYKELDDWGLTLPNFDDNLTNNNDYEGKDQNSKLDKYMDAELKRMFLVFDNDTFDNVIEWMNSIQTQNKLDNHSQVILHLMENENFRTN